MSAAKEQASLDDLMVAMDVVDTLRHNQVMVDRELDAEGRRSRLIERLREIYTAQGIEVHDAVLAEGVDALEQDRFSYAPARESFSLKLARWYVDRDEWGKPLLSFLLFAGIALGGYHFGIQKPKADALAALPANIERQYTNITALSADEAALNKAAGLKQSADHALSERDYGKAESLQAELATLYTTLEQSYQVRVISRPNENSGIFRVPDVNQSARNYYLIVEAVASNGELLQVAIGDEEDGQTTVVDTWGVRVDQRTFNQVADDKRDDGIIQNNIIGSKQRGQLAINYTVPSTGATITAW